MRARRARLFWLSSALGLVALGWALAACPGRYEEPLTKEAIAHRVKTSDGWELALVQYKAHGPAKGRPVLLCHGISANARNMDLDEEHSLARWLARQGREAWTISLRGTGDSDRADPRQGRWPGYGFDALWSKDLQAGIRYVREHNAGAAIDYIGHSMGGMLVYAYLAQGGDGLNAVVTLGSPTRLDWNSAMAPFLERVVKLMLSDETAVPVVWSSWLTLPLQAELRNSPIELLLYNPEHVSKQSWKRIAAFATADIQGGVARQILGYVRSGRFESADGRSDFRAGLAKVRTPVLVVAGKSDRLAIVPAVRDGYRALGGPKEWLLMGVENGAGADYGHMDLVIADRASTELWPKVLDFLDRHRGP